MGHTFEDLRNHSSIRYILLHNCSFDDFFTRKKYVFVGQSKIQDGHQLWTILTSNNSGHTFGEQKLSQHMVFCRNVLSFIFFNMNVKQKKQKVYVMTEEHFVCKVKPNETVHPWTSVFLLVKTAVQILVLLLQENIICCPSWKFD